MIKLVNFDILSDEEQKEVNNITFLVTEMMFVKLDEKQELCHRYVKEIVNANAKPYKLIAFLSEIGDRNELGWYLGFLSGYLMVMKNNSYHEYLEKVFLKLSLKNIDEDLTVDISKLIYKRMKAIYEN